MVGRTHAEGSNEINAWVADGRVEGGGEAHVEPAIMTSNNGSLISIEGKTDSIDAFVKSIQI